MLEDMQVHPQDQQLPIEETTNTIGAQILEFCESDLFPPDHQNPEEAAASTSNCCYDDHHPSYMNTFDETPPLPPTAVAGNSNPFAVFDYDENDISASIDFSTTSPSSFNINNQEHLNTSSLNNNQLSLGDMVGPTVAYDDGGGPERWAQEECLAPYIPGINELGSYLGPGIFMGQELDYDQGDINGSPLYLPHIPTPTLNCSTQLQGVGERQLVIHGGTSSTSTSLASEISSLEDATFKVGKISVEERKMKIHRYLKKRNERNFSKKIKYACRKTLAESRPRVRGRFAKNDELMMGFGNNEDEIDHQDIALYSNSMPHPPRKVLVKEEEEHESSEIYAHISGVNSFKCNYPIQSWI